MNGWDTSSRPRRDRPDGPNSPRRGTPRAPVPAAPYGQNADHAVTPGHGPRDVGRPAFGARDHGPRGPRLAPNSRGDFGRGDDVDAGGPGWELVPTGEVWYYSEPSGPMGRASEDFVAPRRRRPGSSFPRDPDPRRTTGRRHSTAPSGGLSGRGPIIAVAGVVAVVVAVGAVLLTHKSNSSSTGANALPTATSSAKAVKKTSPSQPAGPVYTLSTPATAGGYPKASDPDFLATVTAFAKSFVAAVAHDGGATVKGSPVSASYFLGDAQAMGFVGYQGTFDSTKIAQTLKSLGTDPHRYGAGPHGGFLGCINTSASPSGAVCVWSTTSTLGIVEFFDAQGPETLTVAQEKGASDTVQLRSGVETEQAKS